MPDFRPPLAYVLALAVLLTGAAALAAMVVVPEPEAPPPAPVCVCEHCGNVLGCYEDGARVTCPRADLLKQWLIDGGGKRLATHETLTP